MDELTKAQGETPVKKTPAARTKVLPSGVVAVIGTFKGRHIRESQKLVGTETERYLFALIALTTTFDGKTVIMEDVEEMDGWDVLALMAEFNSSGDAKQ
jgi:hypothetical protein